MLLQKATPVGAGPHYVTPCLQSVLCRGLVEHFDFEEGSDSPRWGAFGTQLNEPPNTDIPNVAGNWGNAVSFAGTTSSFLWKSFAPGPSGYWTIAFWFNPQTLGVNGTKRSIISWDAAATGFGSTGNDRGPDVYLESNGTNVRLCLSVVAGETDSANSVCSGYIIGAGSWNLGVVGQSNFFDGKNQILVSLNAAAPATTATTYYTRPGSIGHVRLGGRPLNGAGSAALSGVSLNTGDQPYQGYLDNLDIFARALSPAEITLLHNSATGRSYPYVTE